MTNEINKIISKVNYQESKTSAGANRVPQKQDTVTLSVGPKDLKESKELLKIQKKLNSLLDSWAEALSEDGDTSYEIVSDVYKPVDLKTGTDAEIIEKLEGEAGGTTTDVVIQRNKEVTEAFRNDARQYCDTEYCGKKMEKIIELFKNPIFKETVYVGLGGESYGIYGAITYLLGITKSNKMLGIFFSYSEE